MAWGHPTGNNCTYEQAAAALRSVWDHPGGLLFHHGKFDLHVAQVHFDLAPPPWERLHDTLLLHFLDDPLEADLGLKPLAVRLLDEPPTEQDAVGDWLIKNQPIPAIRISRSKTSPYYFGAYIAYAPAGLVGDYAIGDVMRTIRLFRRTMPLIVKRGMKRAYDRERQLMPVLLKMEQTGVPVDLLRLQQDVPAAKLRLDRLASWIQLRLASPDLNVDSGEQLLEALQAAGAIDTAKLPLTPSGQFSSAKASLAEAITDPVLFAVIAYRTELGTCIGTFLEPWLTQAEKTGGLIFTTWHQTRGAGNGARTGRLSSTPNFQNIPNEFKDHFAKIKPSLLKKLWFELGEQLPPIPRCRSYIIPMKGHVLVGRDFNQQELRILAHFEDGSLIEQYNNDPWLDFHTSAGHAAYGVLGRVFDPEHDRKPIKNLNLGIIYGQGVPSIAAKNGSTVAETQQLRAAIYAQYPGLRELYNSMKIRKAQGEPILTWGGRVYYCEPDRMVNGRMMSFDYKLVNVLIQGSAAECTKEAMIRYFYKYAKPTWHMLLQVHDELLLSVPAADLADAQACLKEAMESVEFDVPMLSDGEWSKTNWFDSIKYDKKGVIL